MENLKKSAGAQAGIMKHNGTRSVSQIISFYIMNIISSESGGGLHLATCRSVCVLL